MLGTIDTMKFWSYVRKTKSCWLWIGPTMNQGYGMLGKKLAHRLSWEIANGKIPKGMCVLHDCPNGDNRLCVRPCHLWLGTKSDNSADKVRKGRQARGEKHGIAKLTDEKVRHARRKFQHFNRFMKPTDACEIIAKELGVHRATITRVVRRKIWRHLT